MTTAHSKNNPCFILLFLIIIANFNTHAKLIPRKNMEVFKGENLNRPFFSNLFNKSTEMLIHGNMPKRDENSKPIFNEGR